MDKLKSGVNYASETVQGAASTGSKEANKQVAKDKDADIKTRLTAGKDAITDKFNEQKHNTQADVHNEAMKH